MFTNALLPPPAAVRHTSWAGSASARRRAGGDSHNRRFPDESFQCRGRRKLHRDCLLCCPPESLVPSSSPWTARFRTATGVDCRDKYERHDSRRTFHIFGFSGGPHTVSAAFTPTALSVFDASSGSVNQIVKAVTAITPFTAAPAGASVSASQSNSVRRSRMASARPRARFSSRLTQPLGPPVSLDGSGAASYSTSSLPFSSSAYAITALYSGDGFNTASTATLAGGYTVNKANTTVTTPISSTGGTSTYGQSVTLSAAVLVSAPGSGAPTGTITFSDGRWLLGHRHHRKQ